jgi:hypothetical protein
MYWRRAASKHKTRSGENLDNRLIFPALVLLFYAGIFGYRWLWNRRLAQVWDAMGQPLGLQVQESSGFGASPRLTGGYDGHVIEVSTYTNTYKISRNASSQHLFTQICLALNCPAPWEFSLRQEAQTEKAGIRVKIARPVADDAASEEEFWITTKPDAPIYSILAHSRETRDALRKLPTGDILLADSLLIFRQSGLLLSHEYLDGILRNMGVIADAIEEAQHVSPSLS